MIDAMEEALVELRAREESLVAQLSSLYAEREELARITGGEDPVTFVVRQQVAFDNMLAQLESLYAEREDG